MRNLIPLSNDELHTIEAALEMARKTYLRCAATAPKVDKQFRLQATRCTDLLTHLEFIKETLP